MRTIDFIFIEGKLTNSDPYEGYNHWKGWSFGGLSALDKQYFDWVVRKSGCRSPESVIEIGYGEGRFLSYAAYKKMSVVGVETQESLVKRGREAGFNTIFPDQIVDLRDSTFDLVAAFDVFEHIAYDELVDMLKELHQKLKANGVLVARFPNGDSPFSLPLQNGDKTHIQFLGSSKVRSLAIAAGFEVLYCGRNRDPVNWNYWKHAVRACLSEVLRFVLEPLVRWTWAPGTSQEIFSSNLLVVLRHAHDAQAKECNGVPSGIRVADK